MDGDCRHCIDNCKNLCLSKSWSVFFLIKKNLKLTDFKFPLVF